MKKFLVFLLMTLMICEISPVCFGASVGLNNFQQSDTNTNFNDVSANSWYFEDVQTAAQLGLMKGTRDASFNPDGNLTIIEAIILACRIHSIYNGNGGEFQQRAPWYQVYIDYATTNKLISINDYADYQANATRAQFAVILATSLPSYELPEINHVDDKAIPDVPMDSSYANTVYALYRAGILSGNDSIGTFAPSSYIQRSAVAAIVSRMAVPSLRKNLSLYAGKTLPTDVEWTQSNRMYANYLEIDGQYYELNGHVGQFISVNGELYGQDIVHVTDIAEGQAIFATTDNPLLAGRYASDSFLYNPNGVATTCDRIVQYITATEYFHITTFTYHGKAFSTPDSVTFGSFIKDEIRMYGESIGWPYQGEITYWYNISDVLKYWGLEGDFEFKEYDDAISAGHVLVFHDSSNVYAKV